MAWFVSRRNCPSCLTANTVAGPLDRTHLSGSAGGNHQDPPAAVLRPGRATHSLGAPPHSASPPALALGGPVQPRPGPAASHSIPSLTAPSATDPPPDNRRSPQTRASPLRDGLLLHAVPPISPSATAVVRHWRPERQLPTATGPICWNRTRTRRAPMPLTLCSNAKTASHRWIRV